MEGELYDLYFGTWSLFSKSQPIELLYILSVQWSVGIDRILFLVICSQINFAEPNI